MLENERKMVKEIDESILGMLKEKMKIKEDKVNILCDDDIEKVFNKINEKMEVAKINLDIYDKIANNVILKRLDVILTKIEELAPLDDRLVSICIDRKLFIGNVLTKNISPYWVEKNIQEDNEIDEK